MHVMLKRAAASAIPALVGLAIFPATAMAAPHTSQSVAHQGHLAGTARTAETTADAYGFDSTDHASPACPCGGPPWFARLYQDPRPVTGGTAIGVMAIGKDDNIIGDHVIANGGSGIDNSSGGTTGNDVVGTSGNSLDGQVVAAGNQ